MNVAWGRMLHWNHLWDVLSRIGKVSFKNLVAMKHWHGWKDVVENRNTSPWSCTQTRSPVDPGTATDRESLDHHLRDFRKASQWNLFMRSRNKVSQALTGTTWQMQPKIWANEENDSSPPHGKKPFSDWIQSIFWVTRISYAATQNTIRLDNFQVHGF